MKPKNGLSGCRRTSSARALQRWGEKRHRFVEAANPGSHDFMLALSLTAKNNGDNRQVFGFNLGRMMASL
jgi:hypothetical protein